ncbi:Uncharacterised protein [uncultured archaeon]|nr:Uncharacterised protein [uncultured archaeon]
MILLKLHEHSQILLVGIADANVLGKVYEDKNGFLDLKDYADYYNGEEITTETLEEFLKNLSKESKYSVNAVGKETISIIKKRFPCQARTIQGVPHVQIYKL